MGARREHRRRLNEKLCFVNQFELWLSVEPPMIMFVSWRKWLKSRPKWLD